MLQPSYFIKTKLCKNTTNTDASICLSFDGLNLMLVQIKNPSIKLQQVHYVYQKIFHTIMF